MIKQLEEYYPEGSDITIMNTYYSFPEYDKASESPYPKKIMDDFIVIVYKDNKLNKKNYIVIDKPTYIYYMLNDNEKSVDYSRLFIERDRVHPIEVPFTDLEKDIAMRTNNIDFYKKNKSLGREGKNEIRKLHTLPNVFFSDVNIEDHYRFRFANTYTNNITPLKKAFFDIEVDGKDAVGDFVEMGECPINCVSFLDENSKTVSTFILKNSANPLIEKFESELYDHEFGINDIREFIKNTVGGDDQVKKYNIEDLDYKLYFFDSEIDLIKDLFKTMHKCSPDFIEGWNCSGFDIPYIIARIQTLGYDPRDIMCDQTWKYRIVKHYFDERNKNDFAERGDYTFISGLPVFMDQMIQYASRRKAKIGSFKSFKLDDIGELEANVHKLDYHHITQSVVELPWLDFKTFVLYNIMDVMVQKCIETKTQDLEYLFSKAVLNNTVYRKAHRQTIYLINKMAADWYKMGYIIGNNINRWNEKPPKFQGALVHDPLKTDDTNRMHINGRPIWITDNCIDFDQL